MNLWDLADWSSISWGQKGQTTAFWVHGIKSDGEKRNCGTFCFTWPEKITGCCASLARLFQAYHVLQWLKYNFWWQQEPRCPCELCEKCDSCSFNPGHVSEYASATAFYCIWFLNCCTEWKHRKHKILWQYSIYKGKGHLVRVCACCTYSHRARKVWKTKSKACTCLNLLSKLCSTIFFCFFSGNSCLRKYFAPGEDLVLFS